jgi:GntR family transcriptional regulator of arabinose operon
MNKRPETDHATESHVDQPKYRLIFESLKEGILSGTYRSGARLPSEAELSRRFAVSRMTVVQAIKELQKLGLVSRRVGSGTYATQHATHEGYSFGLLIPDLGQTEIFEPICQGMARHPLAGRHSLVWGHSISDSRQKEKAAEELCHYFISKKVSGVFFAPFELSPIKNEVNARLVAALDRAGIPVVLLDRCIEPYPLRSKYDLIGIDNRRTAYIATEYLLKLGARRIAYFAQPNSAPTVDARAAGYREALYTYRIPLKHDLDVRGDASDDALIKRLLRAHKPDAVLCANDHTAATLMQTLIRLGCRIPGDIRIVGIDDVKYASLLPIPLTTQHQPCLDIGRTAMSAMLDRMENPSLPTRDILLSCRMVVRKSCGGNGHPKPQD